MLLFLFPLCTSSSGSQGLGLFALASTGGGAGPSVLGKKLVREGVGGSFVCVATDFALFFLGFLGLAPGFHTREMLSCSDITRERGKRCV